VAHTSLVRALLTGYGLNDSEFPSSGETIGDLRKDFTEAVGEWGIERPRKAKAIPDDSPIELEEIPEIESQDEERWRQADVESQVQHGIILGNPLQEKLDDLLASSQRRDDPEWLDAEEQELSVVTAAKAVAQGERIALNGARQHDADVVRIDKRAWGWIRIHDPDKEDHPCGFCSMLMTRGFVDDIIYDSKQSAGGDGSDESLKYHTNCHCIAHKIYRSEQLKSPVYDDHRRLADEYVKFRDDHGTGVELVREWDKHIRSSKKVAPNEKVTAMEQQTIASLREAA